MIKFILPAIIVLLIVLFWEKIAENIEKLRWLGAARYNIATIINIIVNPVLKAKIYFNDEMHAKDYCFLLACNTRFTGKGMEMAPLAKLNDGLIDFLIVEKTSRLKLLMLFPKIFSGKHLNSPYLNIKLKKKMNDL